MRGSRAGERRGGRQKGTPNKLTSDLRAMVLGALEDAGGRGYLAKQAEENPIAFLALVSKLLPRDIKAELGGTVTLSDIIRESYKPRGVVEARPKLEPPVREGPKCSL